MAWRSKPRRRDRDLIFRADGGQHRHDGVEHHPDAVDGRGDGHVALRLVRALRDEERVARELEADDGDLEEPARKSRAVRDPHHATPSSRYHEDDVEKAAKFDVRAARPTSCRRRA